MVDDETPGIDANLCPAGANNDYGDSRALAPGFPDDGIWASWYAKWIASMRESGLTTAAIRVHGSSLRRFQRVTRVETPRQVTPEIVRGYVATLTGFSRQSVHIWLRGPKKFFRFLVSEGHLLSDPTEGMIVHGRAKRSPPTLTRQDLDRLIASAENLRDRALLAVLYATGLRTGELVALNVDDIEDGAVRVGSRRVMLSADATDALTRYLWELRPKWAVDNALWVGPTGVRLSGQYWAIQLKWLGQKVGLKKVTVDAIRATVAERLTR